MFQRPHRAGARWCGLPFGKEGPPPAGTVGVVVHAHERLRLDRPLAGIAVDGWPETIPATVETAAVSFHYDAPGARAPQAVLLAVHPALRPDKWDLGTLVDTINEAIDLTHLRAVGAPELASLGSLLPGLYLPDNYTHDVPGISLKAMIQALQHSGTPQQMALNVLGKG